MVHRLGMTLMCLAMFSIAGGHWAVLQSVAWAQMIHDYAQDNSLAEAVEMTFSGERPCDMCVRITEGRQQEEQKPITFKVDKKAEIFVAQSEQILPLPTARPMTYARAGAPAFTIRAEQPPQPVPIFA